MGGQRCNRTRARSSATHGRNGRTSPCVERLRNRERERYPSPGCEGRRTAGFPGTPGNLRSLQDRENFRSSSGAAGQRFRQGQRRGRGFPVACSAAAPSASRSPAEKGADYQFNPTGREEYLFREFGLFFGIAAARKSPSARRRCAAAVSVGDVRPLSETGYLRVAAGRTAVGGRYLLPRRSRSLVYAGGQFTE